MQKAVPEGAAFFICAVIRRFVVKSSRIDQSATCPRGLKYHILWNMIKAEILSPISFDADPLLFPAREAFGLVEFMAGDDDDDGPGDNGTGDGDDTNIGIATKTRAKTKKPNPYKVLILNDDYTPMEFVVLVLKRFFQMDIDEATRVMLHVHQKGVGVCGTFSYEVAETKVTQVMDFARKNQHPLQCTLEKA